jgi:hypothetical protein
VSFLARLPDVAPSTMPGGKMDAQLLGLIVDGRAGSPHTSGNLTQRSSGAYGTRFVVDDCSELGKAVRVKAQYSGARCGIGKG